MNKNNLTPEELKNAFLRSVCSVAEAKDRWRQRSKAGLTDEELKEALQYELGIAGGSSGKICIAYQGAGLKIWAAREIFNQYEEKPVFEGKQTMQMARDVFGIKNPDSKQMTLL